LKVAFAVAVRSGDLHCAAKVVDDPSNGIRILDQDCNAVTVEDKKAEGREDQEPACD
jgi:hypothetical protein